MLKKCRGEAVTVLRYYYSDTLRDLSSTLESSVSQLRQSLQDAQAQTLRVYQDAATASSQPQQSPHTRAKPVKLHVTKFDSDADRLLRWIVQVETAADALCITRESTRVAFTLSHLKDQAEDWADDGDLNLLSSSTADESVLPNPAESQTWASLRSNPFFDLLDEFKDVFPDDVPCRLPVDKGIRHEIDLVPGTKYCVTRQWPLPRDQVDAIDAFFVARKAAGHILDKRPARWILSPYLAFAPHSYANSDPRDKLGG
ncbi:hypothetical protein H310_13924 [Aphanomyces invadans]|uniref:Reverse transcriptase n=1 Tax=Aphanomyces invadans TaxID=157072 RepID=A0A024TDY3_9STRA|nr:hypothetical protein H310_13924 [Aphanomyces invadans]ETV91542.1 hypothetical protein H310_13924 [Aphanomyces invadans]|eukprot:XP_008879810.1 hypothetical protein H310_13924 [Aphanomyces invadans]